MPRSMQGSGRHDNPELYGAVYGSVDPVSCVAEALQPFRNQAVNDPDLRRKPNRTLALVQLELADAVGICDLDNPEELQARHLRPSRVAAMDRHLTQEIAANLFRDGYAGFLWWSILESLWINTTLFAERTEPGLKVKSGPSQLQTGSPEVVAAARRLGIRLPLRSQKEHAGS